MSYTPWWAEAELVVLREEREELEDLTMEANVVAEKNAICAEIAGILNLVDVHFGGLGSVPISEEIRAEFRQKISSLKKRGES